MYVYIVISAATLPVKMELFRVTTFYRLRLTAKLGSETFTSIRLYPEDFVARILRLGQDNLSVWIMLFPEIDRKLARKGEEEETEEEEMEENIPDPLHSEWR